MEEKLNEFPNLLILISVLGTRMSGFVNLIVTHF